MDNRGGGVKEMERSFCFVRKISVVPVFFSF